MGPGGLWWSNVLNLALPPQRLRPDTQLKHQDPVSHTALDVCFPSCYSPSPPRLESLGSHPVTESPEGWALGLSHAGRWVLPFSALEHSIRGLEWRLRPRLWLPPRFTSGPPMQLSLTPLSSTNFPPTPHFFQKLIQVSNSKNGSAFSLLHCLDHFNEEFRERVC